MIMNDKIIVNSERIINGGHFFDVGPERGQGKGGKFLVTDDMIQIRTEFVRSIILGLQFSCMADLERHLKGFFVPMTDAHDLVGQRRMSQFISQR